MVLALPLIFFNMHYDSKYKIAAFYSRIFIWLGKFICGLDYNVYGIEKLPKAPYLVVANHQSFWENVFMQVIIPKHSWVLKKELFNIPFFGWGLKLVDPVSIDRSNKASVSHILKQGADKFSQNISLIIFPEATRLRPEQTVRFKPSAAALAIACRVPIVLIAHNAGLLWPKQFWIKKPGIITVKIIEVIAHVDVAGYDARSLTSYLEDKINKEKNILAGLA